MFSKTTIYPFGKYGHHARPCHVRHGNRNRDWDTNNNHNQNHMYGYDGYLLFQSEEVKVPITLAEVRDAVESCSGILNEQMKDACYLYFGVNGKMAEKYYSKMERMEKLYRSKEDPKNPKPPADTEPLVSPKQKQQKKPKKGMFGKWFIFRKKPDAEEETEADVE